MKCKLSIMSLVITLGLIINPNYSLATILADIVADFSTTGANPDNNWSHGQYMGSSGVAYTPADFAVFPNWSSPSTMFYQNVSTVGYYAFIQKRDVTGIDGNWIYSVPDTLLPGGTVPAGGQGCYNVSRWTSDFEGEIQIDLTYFRAAGTIVASIAVDGTEIWSDSNPSTDKYNPSTATITTNINLNSVVDFIVKPGTSRGQDGFFYQAKITEILPASFWPEAPAEPLSYTFFTNVITVSNGAELANALSQTTPSNIVLADGTYTYSSYVSFNTPHRLWAEHFGNAVLKFGLSFGGNSGTPGAEIHGLRFDIDNANLCSESACIQTWGSAGTGLKVTDCWFDGNNVLDAGILARAVDGLEVKRVVVENFLSWGIYACDYPAKQVPATPVLIEDTTVNNISQADPGSGNGTCEAGIWLGNKGTVSRAIVRNCAWMGVWTGSWCVNSILKDLDIDDTPRGIYIENISHDTVYKNFVIGPSVTRGFVSEWNLNNPELGGDGNIIRDGLIDATSVGVFLDQGTKDTTIQNVIFRNSSNAGIGMYMSPTCSYSDCIFELPTGVPEIRYDHPSQW